MPMGGTHYSAGFVHRAKLAARPPAERYLAMLGEDYRLSCEKRAAARHAHALLIALADKLDETRSGNDREAMALITEARELAA